ncbi:MAG: DNA polymerase [Candidatus Paceibacterota bacterium]|jgi:DNA polymerase-1
MAKKSYKTKIVLIDAHAILHRAYHALPDFSSSKGEPTGGLYGLASMMLRIIADLKPDYLIACYDRAEPTFRKQIYDDYKAGRRKAEPELVAQIIRSHDIFTALHIPIYDLAGFEADDIIGTVVEKLKKEKDTQIVIASGDMDTLQLVDDDRVVVFTLKKGLNDTVVYNEKMVKERYGFDPQFLIDYKGLRGDPSDNIIGVEGIGEKTATTLIQEFGTIEDIYKQIKKDEQVLLDRGIKARIIEILKNSEEEAIFSKTLATIRRDAKIDFKLPKETWAETFDTKHAEDLFSELEFRTLIGRLKKLVVSPAAGEVASGYARNDFSSAGEASVGDPTSKEPEVAPHTKPEEKETTPTEAKEIKQLAIALWLINSDITNPKLEDIFEYTKTEDLAQAREKLLAELGKLGLTKVYQEIELPLIPILEEAQTRGVKIDKEFLAELSKDYHLKLKEREKKIYELAGSEFNINSPKQLGEILFVKLNLSIKGLKKTAGGSQSTRESEIIKLKDAHPVIEEILAYRELQKLLTTYIDNLPKLLDERDFLHATLNQTGTTTGRMSSSNPNVQNIPTRGEQGAAIRNAFVARPGYKLMAFDYSQIELRVLAALSEDPDLVKIFKEGKDIHTSVAARVFKVKEEEVTKEMRRRAKVINFGIIYGMGVNALKVNLGTTRDEAQEFMDNYFASFPTIKKYFELVIEGAKERGYTETLFGRRRYLPALHSPLPQIKASAERMAMNAPLQGTAADIIKLATIRADQDIKKAGLADKIFLLLQIHDELIYEVEESVIQEALPIIKQAMENVVKINVPIEVSSAVGPRWGELEKGA